MIGLVDWAAERARMVMIFILLSITAGTAAYLGLPKEGEPDIEIPALFVSVPFPGISAADSELLLVKPMETELADLDGLKSMSATAAENYAGVALEFEFGWDKSAIMADVRDAMDSASANFPEGAEKHHIAEINFSEFPIIIVNLTGPVPERSMTQIAKRLQDRIEAMDMVLEAGIAGSRDEMLEVEIAPLRLESYNVSAGELISVVQNNNQLIAAGEIESENGAFSITIPSSFDEPQDVYDLPVKTNGDRVITLGDLADIRLTFEDRKGTARFNGENTVALQVVKRKGYNLIGTAEAVKALVAEESATWPDEIRATLHIGTSNDQSRIVGSMVSQLEGSVLTAIALVMIVVLASLGTRAALLVGFAIPTSFLLCFAFLAVMEVPISNIVMFGLILAVGMLVDGAIVVVEYADKRIKEGVGPMHAYVAAAKRMFWPVVSSTATTLCAFLPMLFWPGVPGEFMGMLPVTLIFVLSASLVVALIYLPVMGGVTGRFSRLLHRASLAVRGIMPLWMRAGMWIASIALIFTAIRQVISPDYLLPADVGALGTIVGALLFAIGTVGASIFMDAMRPEAREKSLRFGHIRTLFGRFVEIIVGIPVMPLVTIGVVIFFVITTFSIYGKHNKGVEFFVESEPEQAIIYVLARGNMSLAQKDDVIKQVEDIVLQHPGIQTAFSFAGEGGLSSNTGGAQPPKDSIGQIQLETIPWEDRPETSAPWFTIPLVNLTINHTIKDPAFDGDVVINELSAALEKLPGVRIEVLAADRGPASAKPVHLRVKGNNWEDLIAAATLARARFDATEGLDFIEDTRPLPGIDWRIKVDVAKAGRYGADVATVGAMVQLVTHGILLDTMRVDSSDEEIEIRVRLPIGDRVLSTLDGLKVRTRDGLVPLANFITREPVPKLAEITRVDQKRYFDIKAGLNPDAGLTPGAAITELTQWLDTNPLPAGVEWEWTGDREEEAESQQFLMSAFAGALALMFVILLAQFNSLYNAVLVLLAVVLSTAGVLIGMLVMNQAFSIIMTGTGIVALAGIVVNNNIVLIDTYQEYSRYMPQIEAIVRTTQNRIRPVLLTTITTMAGLTPMMFGLSLNFADGGYAINSPTSLWWTQLATAVVFGLGIATFLTLLFTPAMLAARVWLATYLRWGAMLLAKLSNGKHSRAAQDWALRRAAARTAAPEIHWDAPEFENR